MSFGFALVLAFVIIDVSVVALFFMVSARRRAGREDELRQAASTRGWQFESAIAKGSRVHRWRGTTDGVAWTAESLPSTSRGKHRHQRTHIGRWRSEAGIGATAPIVCMGVPPGKETTTFAIAQGDGWLSQLAQKAAGLALDQAIDTYFGEDLGRAVDASALRRVEGVQIPGFIVMAGDPTEAERVLSQGLTSSLADSARDSGSLLSADHRPGVLIDQHGIALGQIMEHAATVGDIEAFVRAGIKLTRAATFGRPSPS